jgi:universal stress protein A
MYYKHIACCTDFSENADIAFQAALDAAKSLGAKLWVVHVLPPAVNPMLTDTDWVLPDEPKESLLLKLGERMQQEYGDRIGDTVDHELLVLDGHVSTELLSFLEAHPIDLVILGSYGFTGMGLVVFGSVAKRISHRAPCSVMIVRERQPAQG